MNANSTETPVSNLVFLAFLLLTLQVHASDTSIIMRNMPYNDLFARAGKEKNRCCFISITTNAVHARPWNKRFSMTRR